METRTNCGIALRRLDMPLTPAVADAPLVASRHVGKRISLSAMIYPRRNVGLKWMKVASVTAILICVGAPASSGQSIPVDTAGLVAAMLRDYTTPNGPIVQIVRSLRCGDAEGGGWQGRPARCTTAAADSVIAEYANKHNIDVVGGDGPDPTCRWSSAETSGRRGLRLALHTPGNYREQLAVGLQTTCTSSGPRGMSGFFHSVVWSVVLLDGRWQLGKIIGGMIT
jgi:hypothetical protein